MIDLGGHRLVERHFQGKGGAFAGRRMFRHLRRCARCREEYRIQASLEALAGDAEARARERMASAIFPRRRRVAAWRVGGLSVALACLALVLWFGRGPRPFTARGGAGDIAPPGPATQELAIFRVTPGGTGTRVGHAVHAGEPLAFSYRNPPPEAYAYLMVFARDGAGQVFWFWPAWQNPTDDPTSVAIAAAREPTELGESVRHAFRPGPLTVVGLFSRRPYGVREVEAALANGVDGLAKLDARVWSETLEVGP